MRSVTMFVLFAFVVCFTLAVSPDSTFASSKTEAGDGPVTDCDVRAYLDDKDPKGTNVRSGPGSSYKVIGHIPNKEKEGLGVGVHITGSQRKWVRMDRALEEGGDGDKILFKGKGWLYAPLLAGSGVGGGTKLYQEPTEKSRVLGRILPDDQARVHGCRGKWILIEHRKLKGWAAPGAFCPSSLTTCS